MWVKMLALHHGKGLPSNTVEGEQETVKMGVRQAMSSEVVVCGMLVVYPFQPHHIAEVGQ